jgi:hypothetical protein
LVVKENRNDGGKIACKSQRVAMLFGTFCLAVAEKSTLCSFT